MKKAVLTFFLIISSALAWSQVVYQDLTNRNIYEFIDELAVLKIIAINSSIKPYSRELIAAKLSEASAQSEKLNKRQKKELAFYLKEFNLELKDNLDYFKKDKGLFKNNKNLGIPLNPLALIYKDSLFSLVFKPIWGIEAFRNGNGSDYHRWGGAEIFGYIGKHFGYYTNLRDHFEEKILVSPTYLTREEGAVWKPDNTGGGDFSEMRGGITYAWKWGSILLAKDHFEWGEGYHGTNILSGRTPSFPLLQLKLSPVKWFDYTFLTGWLVSEAVDSSRSYVIKKGIRQFYFNKFISAAMMTFTPWKGLNLSLGSSVISCSENYNPALLSPLLFYVNYSYSGNDFEHKYYGTNPALFINISSRQIRHLHLYGSVFMDEFTVAGTSLKGGARFVLGNLVLTAEYTKNGMEVYQQNTPTLTFESNRYGLGHYLRNDSRELFVSAGYKFFRGLHAELSYENAFVKSPALQPDFWKSENISFSVNYEFLNNAYLFAALSHREITGNPVFQPALFNGITNTLSGGFTFGF